MNEGHSETIEELRKENGELRGENAHLRKELEERDSVVNELREKIEELKEEKRELRRFDKLEIQNNVIAIYVAFFSFLIFITPFVSDVPFSILTLASILIILISFFRTFLSGFPFYSAISNANIVCIIWILMGILYYFGFDFTIVRLFPRDLWDPIGKIMGIFNICFGILFLISVNARFRRMKKRD